MLVNNAGIGSFGALEASPMTTARKVFETNTFGVMAMTQAAILQMRKRGSGVIVNVTSNVMLAPHPLVSIYAASKGAIEGFTECLAPELDEAADLALYHAKETGRGGFVRYWPGIGTRIRRRRDAIREVADALAGERIEAHYQPIVRLDTGEIVGLEALCRMRTLDGDVIAAQAFHEATADAHVAVGLTERMAAAIANDIVHWREQGLQIEQVGLNVSTADFYAGSLTRKLEDAFSRSGVALDHLLLEVSEGVYIGHRDRVIAREIEALRTAGVKVALDDFGTGYASLKHLLNVPIDIIKIDQRFIARLRPDDASTIIVEGLIEIARRLGTGVIAEGIETEVQTCQLWSMGCNLGQGFAFARAADRDATARLLHQQFKRIAGTMPLNAGREVTHPEPDRSEPAKRRAAVR